MRRYRGLGVPDSFDEMEHLDALRRQQEADQDREAPLVRINPGAARNGTLGGQQSVTGGGPLIQVVNFADDDVGSLPITVTLLPVIGFTSTGLTGLTVDFRPFARVRWGTQGATTDVEVDVGLGCQFTVGGSTCTVEVGADATGLVAEATANVGAMISFWTTARQMPVFRSAYRDILAAGAGVVFPRPNFSATLHSIQRSPSTAALTVDFQSPTGSPYRFTLAGGTFQDAPIPLSSDITQITVTNNSVGNIDLRALWGLSL